jgi:GcrA cell cycle regulator
MTPTWTEERVELLKKLWAAGRSASECAELIGADLTRNSVVGKVHRLKLVQGQKPGQPARLPRPSKRRLAPRTKKVGAVTPSSQVNQVDDRDSWLEEPAPARRCQILELTDATCRWPVGDPGKPDFHFCGSRPYAGIPYCGVHARIAYQSPAQRRQAMLDSRAERAVEGKRLAAQMRSPR